MSYPPSMVHKTGNRLVVRSVVSGDKLYGGSEPEDEVIGNGEVTIKREPTPAALEEEPSPDCSVVDQDEELPQCKVKRNYACSSCSYYTQNPRYYLHHLKNVHKEKIRIYECPHCLYASKHSQKLQRHIHMVHVMGKRKMLIKTKSSPSRKTTVVKKDPEPVTLLDTIIEREPVLEDLPKSEPETVISAAPADVQVSAVVEEEITNETVDQQEAPLKCSLCSFSSRNPNLVTRHERLVHLKKKFYRCTKCDYITHMKARFTKHVKYHSMPMIKCEMCDFRTPYKWNLDRHNKNHFANGAFKCSQCNFTADIKQSLTVHEMNHHVPPVNQNGAGGLTMPTPAKRRCRVGASDIIGQQENTAADPDLDDLELLRMERESLPQPVVVDADESSPSAITSEEAAQMAAVEITMVKPNAATGCKSLNLKNPTAAAYLNGTLKPEDVILTKNGSVYVKKFKCRVCHYKAAWESEMIRHEVRVHGLEAAPKKKPLPRPIPNLIPIQGGGPNKPKTPDASPPKGPQMSAYAEDFERTLTEKDLNDICAKSCATSSLKDFASLIGAEESFKTERLKDFMSTFSESKDAKKGPTEKASPDTRSLTGKTGEGESNTETKKLPELFKKKNATFFDRLKEKLMVGAGESNNLVCWCGHKSKCLSESLMHQKQHSENVNDKTGEKSVVNGPLISGAELSSTRCQHCRQRCKTSSDLFQHLQSCPEMIKKGSDAGTSQSADTDPVPQNGTEETPMEDEADAENYPEENDDEYTEPAEPDKEENKVFVWNNFSEEKEECEEYADEENRSKSPASEASLVGYEIAPGIGSVIPNNNEDTAEQFKMNNLSVDVGNSDATTKKVFKCPKCTFWASTASRFHVHIVSHLNVKPFGCSVCAYQSKWKWDVTKHIRLKKERDASHEHAEMRTIDVETGRRNYTKYNKYLTFMRVHEPDCIGDASKLHSPKTQPSSVPILPKLTPAPSVDGEAGARTASKCDADASARPLPQLHPANPNVSLKRVHDSVDDSEIPKKKTPSEKKMWKCKKCKFRNTDRNVVLSHVKEHYTGANNAQNSNESGQENRNRAEGQDVNQSSQLIASGDSSAQNTPSKGNLKCEHCNFETDCQQTLKMHNRHHVENPNALFKCCFCRFYANDKQFMLNHISSHGVQNVEESLPLIANNPVAKEETEEKFENGIEESECGEPVDGSLNGSAVSGNGDEMEVFKRFKCNSCPYVTNNKSQYLYHKQFHRLRGAPFKCNICTYNVTKRHLLHQHLKIHGVKRAQFRNCINDAVEKETNETGLTLNTDVETANLPDIPLVWVHKGGTLTKMFKCRHCPHVNLRKSNIHEHEKMHFDRVQRSPNGSVSANQASVHRCTECNYVCNNAGALASHFKVHQGAFGQICALADPRRSDESQIKEIIKLLKEDERFAKRDPAQSSEEIRRKEAPSPNHNDAENNTETISIDRPNPEEKKILHFCNVCPARFMFMKDLDSHSRFHSAHHAFKCNSCTYSAPQQAQLLAHKRVHSHEYYEKTNVMCVTLETSKEFPRPKTTFIVEKPGFPGLGWIVIHNQKKNDETGSTGKPKTVTKQYACHKCPAQFFKSVALQHHLTLHGGKDPYQCRSCDYRVKTYGNLIKHEAVHGLEPRMKAKNLKNKKACGNTSIPCSGTELFQHRSEQIMKEQSTPPPPPPLSVDPEFGVLMHGSPEFVYPTTFKNGKMKDKRYKCHKCPSAFEKREQYKIHLPLHGAKFRYKCEKCDYSVKYAANYSQHMRKHEFNERSLSERRASVISKASEESGNETSAENVAQSMNIVNMSDEADGTGYSTEKSEFTAPGLLLCNGKASKTLHISVADQQAVVLMQEKVNVSVNMADQLHRCYYCPYSHQRKDAVENHERCHFNNKGSYVCEFCNYTVPQPHILREHQKLHFGGMKGVKAEAFMKCDRLEIWMETEEGKVLIFKDNGHNVKEENRFEPSIKINEEDSEYKKMYVDVKTGEEFTPKKQSPIREAELQRCADDDKQIPKPFKLSDSSSSSLSSYSSPNHVKDEELPEDGFDVKKEPLEYEDIAPEEEDIDDELDPEIDHVEDEEMPELDEMNVDPDDEAVKEEEESVELGLTSDMEYNDTDVEIDTTENTNMEKCVDDMIDDSLPANNLDDGDRQIDLGEDSEQQSDFKNVDESSRISDDSDSEDSDSSSSSSSCSTSSCTSKSSNASSNPSSNASSDDEDNKDGDANESLINSNNED